MHRASDLGYNINRGSNGIALPRSLDLSTSSGLPVHSGRHLSARHEGSADGLLRSKLNNLEMAHQRGKLSDNQVLERVGDIENSMRGALNNNTVRLQATDPHWRP